MSFIEHQNLRLRRLKLNDLQNMIELESDDEVMRFTSLRKAITAEESLKRLHNTIDQEGERAPLGIWAIEFKESQEFVGWIMLLNRQYEHPELGFMIAKRHWGKGLTATAAKGLVDYAFQKIGLVKIVAVTTQENFASKKVLLKVGFKQNGTVNNFDKVLNCETVLDYFEITK